MKAIPLRRSVPLAFLALAACSVPRVVPTSPAPAPAPAAPPPRAPVAPPPPPPPNWQDAAQTAGDWTWTSEGGRSVARFGGNLLSFTCDRARGTVAIARQGASANQPNGEAAVRIMTTNGERILRGRTAQGNAPSLVAEIGASDTLLDAIAFSRGRFAVQAAGLPTLYVPSWPEISRVIEDCR